MTYRLLLWFDMLEEDGKSTKIRVLFTNRMPPLLSKDLSKGNGYSYEYDGNGNGKGFRFRFGNETGDGYGNGYGTGYGSASYTILMEDRVTCFQQK